MDFEVQRYEGIPWRVTQNYYYCRSIEAQDVNPYDEIIKNVITMNKTWLLYIPKLFSNKIQNPGPGKIPVPVPAILANPGPGTGPGKILIPVVL